MPPNQVAATSAMVPVTVPSNVSNNKGPGQNTGAVVPVHSKVGKLTIKCLRGLDLKAGQGMFGKADPLCKLRIGTQEYSTQPNPSGGRNPVWNEEFVFEIANEREIEVEVLGKTNSH